MDKKNFGQFNTVDDLWLKKQIIEFISNSNKKVVVDPFAGNGDLLFLSKSLGFKKIIGYDIDKSFGYKVNDSLLDIPHHSNAVVITNPPYLSKVSASRKKYSNIKYFENNKYSDIYQIAIDKTLCVYDKAVFIIPETYILTDFFKDYLEQVTIVEDNPFVDTECPICVACFDKNKNIFFDKCYDIYKNDEFLFNSIELETVLNKYNCEDILSIKFNDANGNVGLKAIDGVDEKDRIKFCHVKDLNYNLSGIKHSSRAITVLNINRFNNKTLDILKLIKIVNVLIEEFRNDTKDVVLAPFKNNNKIGKRRRRLDFYYARKLLNKAAGLI